MVLNKRTKLVAKCVMELLNATDPFSKTIIFCEDVDHAERMRVAIFKAVKEDQKTKGDFDLPEHFSIEQAPETVAELADRNAELLNLGITPIWFPSGEYDKV